MMTDVIKSFCSTSTDGHHAATANLLHEIIMVRDNSLTLSGWFTRDIFSICVNVSREQCVRPTCALCAFCCFFLFYLHCLLCLSIVYFGYDFNNKYCERRPLGFDGGL